VAPSSRNLLVWMHVVASVGWMSQALALVALISHSLATGDRSGYEMAYVLDEHVLIHLADAAILSGVMLSAMTRWGFFRHWWVLVKFVITMSQLYVAVFLLSPRLTALAEGAADSDPGLLAATLLMASALAFQVWLSVAKPGGRTSWAPARFNVPPPPPWAPVLALLAPVADALLAELVFGHPAPLFATLTAIGYPILRAAAMRTPAV
jgi:hypothetical protein